MNEITAFSYGRVNLIGEHTDYNGGWVLPTTIPQKTSLRLRIRKDLKVVALSHQRGDRELTYELGQETPTKTWIDYLQGITRILREQGYKFSGFDLWVDSQIPIGSGLSSSAALEVSFLRALREAFDLCFSDLDLARIGQRSENEFVGARVGIMDQMACTLAQAGEALFLDTRDLTYERISLPLDLMDLVVINSGVSHSNSLNEYNIRRAQCEEACRLLGISQLRDLDPGDLHRLESLPELLHRRARHVITENHRVHLAVQALRRRQIETLGGLFHESHASMRDDYETSIPEIDSLVEIATAQPEVFGARLTGGGFGGSVVALARAGLGSLVARRVADIYRHKTGQRPAILVPPPPDEGPALTREPGSTYFEPKASV